MVPSGINSYLFGSHFIGQSKSQESQRTRLDLSGGGSENRTVDSTEWSIEEVRATERK